MAFSSADGWYRSSGAAIPAAIDDCANNGMRFLYLDATYTELSKTITRIRPHYTIRMILDIYYIGSLNNEFGKVLFDGVQFEYRVMDYWGNMSPFQTFLCDFSMNEGGGGDLNVYTVTGLRSPHTASSVTIRVDTDIDQAASNEAILIRNVQVFI